jgi:hypothetical protein
LSLFDQELNQDREIGIIYASFSWLIMDLLICFLMIDSFLSFIISLTWSQASTRHINIRIRRFGLVYITSDCCWLDNSQERLAVVQNPNPKFILYKPPSLCQNRPQKAWNSSCKTSCLSEPWFSHFFSLVGGALFDHVPSTSSRQAKRLLWCRPKNPNSHFQTPSLNFIAIKHWTLISSPWTLNPDFIAMNPQASLVWITYGVDQNPNSHFQTLGLNFIEINLEP